MRECGTDGEIRVIARKKKGRIYIKTEIKPND